MCPEFYQDRFVVAFGKWYAETVFYPDSYFNIITYCGLLFNREEEKYHIKKIKSGKRAQPNPFIEYNSDS